LEEKLGHDELHMRHALEVGQLHSQVEELQQALENECLHSARVFQQLQAELLHVRSLTDAEAAARASESSLQERLERAKKVRGD
jgi:phosphoribosylformimino-5-aminoimidazole carboxamide ribonucleotide (ProFAR) isomerase